MTDEPEMIQRLTRQNLHGVWAAITTPFDDNDRFDEDALRENVRRLAPPACTAFTPPIATASSTPSSSMSSSESSRVFRRRDTAPGVPSMAGVTWCNTQGMIDRLRFAADRAASWARTSAIPSLCP